MTCHYKVLKLLCSISILITGCTAEAHSLSGWLQRPPNHEIISTNSLHSLSSFIGIALSDWGTPSSLLGDYYVDVFVGVPGLGDDLLTAIRIHDLGNERLISIRAMKAWDERILGKANTCK